MIVQWHIIIGYNDLYLKDNKNGYCHKGGRYDFDDPIQVAGSSSFTFVDYEVFQLIPNH